MSYRFAFVGFLFVLFSPSFAVQSLQANGSPTSSSFVPNPTACGDIVNSNDTYVFNASTVYNCLTSVPFNPAVATRFITYYNDTLQFQSSLAYLKDPPPSYQQPATDLIAGLERIQQDIDNGLFPNQYSFEATLQNLIYSSHDSHVQLVAGALAPFTFSAPYEIASVSIDGIQLPKVYISEDLAENLTQHPTAWQPSAISAINGQDVVEYLTQFAAVNSIGGLEPHADWNMLMQSAALDIQGYYEIFAGATTFYPGDTITFNFENGSSTGPLSWLALYNSPGDTGPLETGGDFYNFFVLGLYPEAYFDELQNSSAPTAAASTDAAAATSTSNAAATSVAPSTSTATGWDISVYGLTAYPDNADVVQSDLGITGGGFLSGYFLNGTSTAVLSIPSFDEYGDAVDTFSDTVSEFISRSLAAGLKKVVIDVQQNDGGDIFLAIDAFKQFFPSTEPFLGSRRRDQSIADVLGETMTDFWESLDTDDDYYYALSVDEWVIVDRLNAATGQNFTSWAEYFGPASEYKDDGFSETERYNLSSWVFDVEASGGIPVYGYTNRTAESPQPPYAAEDIVILTDGLCSSACSVFMEMMHHEAGVRTVVAGGRPNYGPMQAPGQSRGARMYSTDSLDSDILFAQAANDTTALLLPNRTANQDVWVTFASVNLRDQIRKGENVPLQFVYEAADCRIFYTPQTWYNYTALWQYAADAIWTNPALCVQGSAGYATTAANFSDVRTPPAAAPRPNVPSNLTGIVTLSGTPAELPVADSGEIPDVSRSITSNLYQSCASSCPGTLACVEVTTCPEGKPLKEKQCIPQCSSSQPVCSNGYQCQFQGAASKGPQGQSDFRIGVCPPPVPRVCTSKSSNKGSVKAPLPHDDFFERGGRL